MISQSLLDKNKKLLNSIISGDISAESVCDNLFHQLSETDAYYTNLIEDNAELHKEIAKLRTENNELYQESAKNKGL